MYRNSVLWAALIWIASTSALAQGNPQLSDMNAEALEAYQNLDIDTAKAKLEQAIGMAGQQGYVGPELVQLYMTLGVVHVAGASDHDQGLAAFLSALCMQADAQLDPLLSTPDVQQVFIQAQNDAQAGACGAQQPPGTVPPPSSVGLPPSSGGPQIEDNECPPGVKCGGDGDDEDDGPGEFARWFINVGFGMGFGFVQPGMPADSKPSHEEIFEDVPWSLEDVNRNGWDQVTEDANMNGVEDFETRYFFDDTSGWVPDADSYDDYENAEFSVPRATTPVSTQCEADGQLTGPPTLVENGMQVFQQLEPSSYCVRVAASGFVPHYALRLNVGYFLTESFALSIPVRISLAKGLNLGLRGELAFSEQKDATGVPVSWFFGATFGRMFVKPPPKDASREVPFVTSGPVGLHTGINVRIRFMRNLGIIIGPEVSVQFPDVLLNLELPIGVEGAF